MQVNESKLAVRAERVVGHRHKAHGTAGTGGQKHPSATTAGTFPAGNATPGSVWSLVSWESQSKDMAQVPQSVLEWSEGQGKGAGAGGGPGWG